MGLRFGEFYIIAEGVGLNEFGSCALAHSAMDAAKKIVKEYGKMDDDIALLEVEGFDKTVRLEKEFPRLTEEAEFITA